MQKYTVVGEYGPIGGMSITLDIDAVNEVHAKSQFCERMELDYPHEWERMSRRNVYAQLQPE